MRLSLNFETSTCLDKVMARGLQLSTFLWNCPTPARNREQTDIYSGSRANV